MYSHIRARLDGSEDAALLGAIAKVMLKTAASFDQKATSASSLSEVGPQALELASRAHSLEPANEDWSGLMEGAKQFATPASAKPDDQRDQRVAAPVIRIGQAVAAGNLLSSPTPVYPSEARAAGVSGTVSLSVHIGPDGRVMRATLISGSPQLVQSGKDAVAQYVYRPIFIDGQPAEVIAQVDIEFRLDRP
jgi:TonB family protein